MSDLNKYLNDPNDVILDGYENNYIMKTGYNSFFFNDPQNNGLLSYNCNFVFKKQFMFIYGNIPTDILVIISGNTPIDFLKHCAHEEYLANKIIAGQAEIFDNKRNVKIDKAKLVLPILQAFYRAFINEKHVLDELD